MGEIMKINQSMAFAPTFEVTIKVKVRKNSISY